MVFKPKPLKALKSGLKSSSYFEVEVEDEFDLNLCEITSGSVVELYVDVVLVFCIHIEATRVQ